MTSPARCIEDDPGWLMMAGVGFCGPKKLVWRDGIRRYQRNHRTFTSRDRGVCP